MMQRGARGAPTVLVLHSPPTLETWATLPDSDLTTRPDAATILEQRVDDLTKQIGGIDIAEALKNLETRIQKLEREVSRSGKEKAT